MTPETPWPPNAGWVLKPSLMVVCAIDDAVAVGVVQAVDAGRHAEEQIAAVRQDAAADVPGRIVVEAFLHHARGVGHAVAVGVLQRGRPAP